MVASPYYTPTITFCTALQSPFASPASQNLMRYSRISALGDESSGVSFLQDAASELLYPILPIFLTTVLGAPVAAVGVVEGAADGVAAISKTDPSTAAATCVAFLPWTRAELRIGPTSLEWLVRNAWPHALRDMPHSG